ncbi:upstream-binding factor 1-like protein 1 [Bacillus rossius redtenbacheri]|uniref:upstream-binding factor 1-like protein 1 n=1 Tax=Bacillus rossius redtenbacheri TaxID=93214 RepID=UPI002FDD39B9
MSNPLRCHSRSVMKLEEESDDGDSREYVRSPVKATRHKKSSKNSKHAKSVASMHEDNHTCSDEVPDWPYDDFLELINRMSANIPEKDSLSYSCRAEKLNWDEIAFGGYSGDECKETWGKIQKRIRKFRLLREVLEDAKDWVSKPWTNFYRSEKTNRHPDFPKRPLSSYMMFYMEKKDEVARQNPGLDMTSISKRIAEMFNNLSKNEKDKYVSVAATLRKEYEERLCQFNQEHPELATSSLKSKEKKKKSAFGLQKPLTPFKLFLGEEVNRHKNDPEFNRNALTEHCKEKWRNMVDQKKVVWINRALEKEAKYFEELKSLDPDIDLLKMKPVVTKEEKNLAEKAAGKPGKPPNSGYSLFSRIMLMSPEMKQIEAKERMNVISRLWKSLKEEEKLKYRDQAVSMLDQYKLEYASYLESLPEDKQQEELLSNNPKRKPPARPDSRPRQKMPRLDPGATPARAEGAPLLYKGEPPPPPVNMFKLFVKEFAERARSKNVTYSEEEVKRCWQALPAADKERYLEQFRAIKNRYMQEYERFLKGLTQEELKEYSLHKSRMDSSRQAGQSPRDAASGASSSGSSERSSSSSSDSDDSSDSESDSEPSSSSASESE